MLKINTIDNLYISMPWNDIDTVVFDVGNVLVTPGFVDIFKSFKTDRAEEIYRLTYSSPYWAMLDYGSISLDEAIDAMARRHPQLRNEIEFVMHHWMEYKSLKEEGVSILRLCKAYEKKLIVLSNYSEDGFSHLESQFDIFKMFDEIIVSSRIGLVKPDPKIFHYVENKCAISPERTLLIDDKAVNCAAALCCGWNAICADIPGKLSKFFAIDEGLNLRTLDVYSEMH